MIDQIKLRLSAQRALLGRVHLEIRLVKIKAVGKTIILSLPMDSEPSGRVRDDASSAAAEIISDFPEAANIQESFEVTADPIAPEDVFETGWVFRRAE